VLRTPSGKVELAPAVLAADVVRLRAAMERQHVRAEHDFLLIGRRELRSNNSWMHNLPVLVKGKDDCALEIHPDDAARLGLADGARACIVSETGSVEAPVRVTDAILPGVVCLPHGWGHNLPGVRLGVAAAHAGANVNRLISNRVVDPLSGNAVLNAVPVTVEPVE
jgi:anaerobic selenocysteine-containing dehydrogenase